MAGPIKISFLADVGKAKKDVATFEDEVGKAGKAAEASGGGIKQGFDAVGKAAVGMNAAVDTASSGLAALDQIQNGARNEASRLARAQLDVQQAELDGKQAAADLRQATEDLKQAQIDGRQAAVDIEQAQVDSKQANLDVAKAQKAYTDAVRAHGKDSVEARQAEVDLAQAKADVRQADVDLSQAQADARQAQIDATQATNDGQQAQIDAKTSAQDLAAAQREINPTPIQQAMRAVETYAPVLAAAGVAAEGFRAVQESATLATVGQKVASLAGAAATGIATAAQWALNVALSANPVGLVVLAIAALVAGIVIAYKKSDTFRGIVNALGSAIRSAAAAVWDFVVKTAKWVADLVGKIGGAFGRARELLGNAGRAIMQGLLDGLKSGWETVKGFLGNVTGWIPDWKGPRERDRTLLRGSGRLVMGGFLAGLESQYGDVRTSLAGFTGSLTGQGTAAVSGALQVTAAAPSWAQRLEALLTGGLTITLTSSGTRGDDALLELIKDRVQVKGGNASVLGISA